MRRPARRAAATEAATPPTSWRTSAYTVTLSYPYSFKLSPTKVDQLFQVTKFFHRNMQINVRKINQMMIFTEKVTTFAASYRNNPSGYTHY
jgi:hypothetical protein